MSSLLSEPVGVRGLTTDQQTILSAVKAHCERLLDHTPRFRYFTLHGKQHLTSLFGILDLLQRGGVDLDNEQLFLLSLAICIHDLGMVVPLGDKEIREILDGRPGFPDATALENYVRERHHELLDVYLERELGFLLPLGITPAQIGLARDIARCHRRVVLERETGIVRDLGGLLRIIDELDIGSARAPADVFLNISEEMDSTSCWHWFKHNIVEPWVQDHTVAFVTENGRKQIWFTIIVRPTRLGSVGYWVTQIRRPINKALRDDGVQEILRNKFNVLVDVKTSAERCSVNSLGQVWAGLEEKALSSNRKVVLVIDDEVRKLEDLFLPLMDNYHIVYAYNADDAFSKLQARAVDLAIVDMQIGSGGIWSATETQDFKATGRLICQRIFDEYPATKVGVLTGTRYSVKDLEGLKLAFFLRKPVDPAELTARVRNVLC